MSVLGTFAKIIPAPQYLKMPCVGVDISDTSLKYIQFQPDKRSGTQLELAYWGDIDIPESALHRGTVHDIKLLSQVVGEVRDRTGMSTIRVSLPEERAYLFETEIKKGTPFKEIRGLLEFRLEENVPLSPRDAFFDYDIIHDDFKKDSLRVSVTAYARETIMNYYEACVGAGMTPLSFEVEAQAIARATIPKGDSQAHMIVDFGKTRTGIGIVYQGTLMYTSTIDIGGAELSASLRRQLGDTPESELTKIKNTQGLVRTIESSDVYDALLPTMSAIVDEIRTRKDYWNFRDNAASRQVQSVILCGGSVNMKGLPEYFTEMLGIPAQRADVWSNAFSLNDHVPAIGRRYSYGYSTAIGLALASFT